MALDRSRARTLAVALWVVTTALSVVAAILTVVNLAAHPAGNDPLASWGLPGFGSLFGLTFGTVGLVVTRRLPGNLIGWLFGAIGLLFATEALFIEYRLANCVQHRRQVFLLVALDLLHQNETLAPVVADVGEQLDQSDPEVGGVALRRRPIGLVTGLGAVELRQREGRHAEDGALDRSRHRAGIGGKVLGAGSIEQVEDAAADQRVGRGGIRQRVAKVAATIFCK